MITINCLTPALLLLILVCLWAIVKLAHKTPITIIDVLGFEMHIEGDAITWHLPYPHVMIRLVMLPQYWGFKTRHYYKTWHGILWCIEYSIDLRKGGLDD